MKNHEAQNAAQIKPQRGEIWRVNLEPVIGREMQKNNRPVLVLSRASVGESTLRICAPITEFKPQRDALRFWRVAIGNSPQSGLDKMSCADVSQTRSLDVARFLSKDGKAHGSEIEAAAKALAEAVGVRVPSDTPPEKSS